MRADPSQAPELFALQPGDTDLLLEALRRLAVAVDEPWPELGDLAMRLGRHHRRHLQRSDP